MANPAEWTIPSPIRFDRGKTPFLIPGSIFGFQKIVVNPAEGTIPASIRFDCSKTASFLMISTEVLPTTLLQTSWRSPLIILMQ